MNKPSATRLTRVDGQSTRVLIVDKDPLMLAAVGSVMDMQGYQAVLARTETVAHKALKEQSFDAVIFSVDDLATDCQIAHRLRSEHQVEDLPIIFLTEELTQSARTALATQGGVFCMLKPVEPDQLIEFVERVLWMPHIANARLGAPKNHLQNQHDWVHLSDY